MILEMSREHYLTLIDEAEGSPDSERRRRAMVLARVYEGKKPTGIHRFIGCARSWIYALVERFHAEGLAALDDLRKPHHPTKANPEFMAQVVTLLKTSPRLQGLMRSILTCELLSIQMWKETPSEFENIPMDVFGVGLGVKILDDLREGFLNFKKDESDRVEGARRARSKVGSRENRRIMIHGLSLHSAWHWKCERQSTCLDLYLKI